MTFQRSGLWTNFEESQSAYDTARNSRLRFLRTTSRGTHTFPSSKRGFVRCAFSEKAKLPTCQQTGQCAERGPTLSTKQLRQIVSGHFVSYPSTSTLWKLGS